MKILPAATQPWDETFARSHTPRPSAAVKGYRSYRPCLRWEFGFSCAFCLMHEADLGPTSGDALMETEHFVPVSHDRTLENQYSNCFYACHFCNHSRSSKPIFLPSGARLLNPCTDRWSDYFVLEDDQLRPRDEAQPGAVYTLDTYDLNDERKVRMRWLRRGVIEDFNENWEDCRWVSDELLGEVAQPGRDPALQLEKLNQARDLRDKYTKASLQLERFYQAIPWNAPSICDCVPPRSTPLTLPAALDRQTLEIDG